MAVDASARPVRLVVREDDLRQSRLTVFFRLLLALPHLVWLVLWSIVAMLVAWIGWLTAIVLGRLPGPFHRFLSAYVRYGLHVFAYLLIATRRFPGFLGRTGYELDLEIDPPARQRRLGVLFRTLLAYPAALLAIVVGTGVYAYLFLPIGPAYFLIPIWGGLVQFGFLAWWSALVRGRMSSGLRDFTHYGIGYRAQVVAYVVLLTNRYPHASPSLVQPGFSLPPHPIRLRLTDALRRSRLTVFFRLLLALPHFIWLWLWGIAAALAVTVAWVVALAIGRVPVPLHRFLAAYTRYAAHVMAFATLVGGPFPGFVGRQGSYPVDIEIDPPQPQRRLVTLFRLLLAYPTAFLLYVLMLALGLAAIGSWFYALVLGRAPEGLRNLSAASIRYFAQVNAYLLLVTSRYPHSSPGHGQPEPAIEPPAEPVLGAAS